MKSTRELLSSYDAQPIKKRRGSERAELLGHFALNSGIKIGRVAFMVAHLKELKDLYYLKSDCDQASARGVPFSAAFRHALKVSKK